MSHSGAASPDDVFINCPFDAEYKPIFDALIFTVFACEFRPRCALELEDGSQPRIEKLYGIIGDCRFGVHDLSRTEVDARSGLPRFNMPLELGVFLGAKKFGDDAQRQKRCLVLDLERYRYQQFISDLSGMDIREHGGDIDAAIACVRNWLANVSRRRLPGAKLIQAAYADFLGKKPAIAAGLGFDLDSIPHVDYEAMVTTWLLEAEPPKRKKKSTE